MGIPQANTMSEKDWASRPVLLAKTLMALAGRILCEPMGGDSHLGNLLLVDQSHAAACKSVPAEGKVEGKEDGSEKFDVVCLDLEDSRTKYASSSSNWADHLFNRWSAQLD